MGIFSSEREKNQAWLEGERTKHEAKQRQQQEKQQAQAEVEFRASPVGQALTAYESGVGFFETVLEISAINRIWGGFYTDSGYNVARTGTRTYGDVLSQIEAVGWELAFVNHVWSITGSQSRDKFLSSGQDTSMTGELVGIYIFRRVEKSPHGAEA